jgi:hypothetical protein
MIVDQRIYTTIYTVLALAWIAIFPMIGRASFEATDRLMKTVAGVLSIVVAVNFIDWLWS